MSNVTDHLFTLGWDIIKRFPEVRDNGWGYEMADDGGVEIEVGEFLYGMVKILKPKNILETGTYTGISAMYMGQGLKDNGRGKLTTLEIEQQHKTRAEELWKQTQVRDYIDCILEDAAKFTPDNTYGLIFLDSEPDIRWGELVKFFPVLNPGGYVFIHDVPPNMCQGNVNPDHPEIKSWPFGDLPQEIKNWIKDGELVKFHFPNPRGMVGFYKPKLDDYKIL